LAFLVSMVVNRMVNKSEYEPRVSILIAAHNEEEHIQKTIENKLSLQYSDQNLEIIVISDGSDDNTDSIVEEYESRGVKLLKQYPRSGKTAALNMAVPITHGEIIVFSDANSLYESDAIKVLVQNFSDPTVGYVTGKMIYVNSGDSPIGDGCTAYMKYENVLRRIETRLGSVVGVDGGIDAVRKNLYETMNPDQLPDFVLPLHVVERGYRVVYEPQAVLREHTLKDSGDEYKMRVRVSLRALWALSDMRSLLSFKKHRLFAWQLWSHKVLRYMSFVFLIGAYLSNLFLWGENVFYKLFFVVQNTVLFSAVMYPSIEKKGYKLRVLNLMRYFVVINLASAYAFLKFIFRQKQVTWTPRKG